jgi:transposase
VRSILFLVAAIAARYDKGLAEFHKRLSAAGKPKNGHPHRLGAQTPVRLNAKARETRAIYANAT